jgi:hypothetical protein
LVLNITFFELVFGIAHGGNLLPSGSAMQARNIVGEYVVTALESILTPSSGCNKRAWGLMIRELSFKRSPRTLLRS